MRVDNSWEWEKYVINVPSIYFFCYCFCCYYNNRNSIYKNQDVRTFNEFKLFNSQHAQAQPVFLSREINLDGSRHPSLELPRDLCRRRIKNVFATWWGKSGAIFGKLFFPSSSLLFLLPTQCQKLNESKAECSWAERGTQIPTGFPSSRHFLSFQVFFGVRFYFFSPPPFPEKFSPGGLFDTWAELK